MAEQNGELELNEFPPPKQVSIKRRNGEVRKYLIGETTGPKEYWQTVAAIRKLNAAGVEDEERLVRMPELAARLISLCTTTADGRPVSEEEIRSWGNSTQENVFAAVVEMNGMAPAKEDDKKEGKESGGGENSGGGSTSPSA